MESSRIPWMPQGATAMAGKVDTLFVAVLAVCLFFAMGIGVFIVYFTIKYREGRRVDRSAPVTNNVALEISWMVLPMFLAIGIFVWAAGLYIQEYQAPADAMEIYVVGRQWMWKLQHPAGRREINQLHVPLGRAIKLTLTSQDVIHSFYMPAFRIKQDALPGRYTSLWFQAEKTGKFRLFCAEYCGTNHSFMGGWVTVMQPAEYERWLHEGDGQPSMAEAGEKLFLSLGCSGCHGPTARVAAPGLEGIYNRPVPVENKQFVNADDAYLRDSILLPEQYVAAGYQPIMPSYTGRISEDELLQIIEYIKSLSRTPAQSVPAPPAARDGVEIKRNFQLNRQGPLPAATPGSKSRPPEKR